MMGLLATGDEKSLENFQEIIGLGKFQVGIVIGQKHEDKAFIVHLAPVPVVTTDNDEEVAEGSESLKQSSSLYYKPSCIADISETAVAAHTRQVIRMLPGGLDVLGLYLTLPLSDLNSSLNQGKLRVVLTALHKASSKYYLGTEESDLEKIILYGCTQSLKNGVKSMDLSEQGTSLVSGILKSQATSWIEINYNYSLSYPIYLDTEKSTPSLSRSVLASFRPWTKIIQDSIILINGKQYNGDDILDPATEEKPAKRKGGGTRVHGDVRPPKVMTATFLESSCGIASGVSEIKESSGSVVFSGTIVGRAFVHGKATAQEAFDALKRDLMRSLVSRWEMHCDSLVDEPQGTTAEPVFHEPPRRVFLEGGGLPVSLCDYLFPGDTLSDACLSAKELLDITVSADNVDDSLENWTDTSTLLDNVPEGLSSSTTQSTLKTVSLVSRSNAFHFIVAVIIGVAAIGISYLIMTRSKPES